MILTTRIERGEVVKSRRVGQRVLEAVTLAPGLVVEGFFLDFGVFPGCDGDEPTALIFRGVKSDFAIPLTRRLKSIPFRRDNRTWFIIRFVRRVPLGKVPIRYLWSVEVIAHLHPPLGVRGSLRRSGRRLVTKSR